MRKINKYAKMYKKQLFIMMHFTLLYTAIVTTITFTAMTSFLKYEISHSLYSSAVSLALSYDLHGLEDMQIMMDKFKEMQNIESAIYMDEKKIMSTSGSNIDDIINEEVHEEILTKGIYIKNNINVNGDGYYNCYITLYDEHTDHAGTVFVGKDVDLMKSVIRGKQMLYVAFIWIMAIIFIGGIFIVGSRYYAKYLDLKDND